MTSTPPIWRTAVCLLVFAGSAFAQPLDVEELKARAGEGDAKSQNALGAMYNTGQGVAVDYAEALKWYQLAADQGDPMGFYNLGYMHYAGRGVPQDHPQAMALFQQSAAKGFAVAQYTLGNIYKLGRDVRQDFYTAFQWFEAAAQQGYGVAQYQLGLLYFEGHGVEQNFVQAFKWLTLAAGQNNEHALSTRKLLHELMAPDQMAEGLRLAAEFSFKKAAPKAPVAAAAPSKPMAAPAPAGTPLERLQARAEAGEAEAQFELALAYHTGVETAVDSRAAFKWMKRAAEAGFGRAQRLLGSFYLQGQGVEADNPTAYRWLESAARQGVTGAAEARDLVAGLLTPAEIAEATRLADAPAIPSPASSAPGENAAMPASGETGSRPEPPAASPSREQLESDARAGNPAAQWQLARVHSRGLGVEQDLTQAAKWARQAAEQGQPEAQLMFGLLNAQGRGVKSNRKEAVRWLRRAAEQGNTPAQFWLGMLHGKGEDAERVRWYREAAGQGHALAQVYLGNLCFLGQGVAQDFVQAYQWFDLAASQNNFSAAQARDLAAEFMTASQIAEANRRAALVSSKLSATQ